MANKLVSVRVPQELLKNSSVIAKREGYANTQDFIREALREHVKRHELENSLRELDRLAGSLKGKKIKLMTRAERDALARRLYP